MSAATMLLARGVMLLPCPRECGRTIPFREVSLSDEGLRVAPMERCRCESPGLWSRFAAWFARR
jgi:hypothetical protein